MFMSKSKPHIQDLYRLEYAEQAVALLNPLRAEVLRLLCEPASASEIGRQVGETAQKVNYHLKALEKVGLIRRSGTRQVKNLVEVLYQAIARSYLIPDAFGWPDAMIQRMKDQGALSHLIMASERLRGDAMRLMELADEAEVPSAVLETEVYLPDEAARQAFVRDYAEAVRGLSEKYGAAGSGEGTGFRVMTAVYPEPEGEAAEPGKSSGK
ncbi:Helix-turn-helix domain-containing protein [Paenibacillus sp. UNCCL117]|nr:Helix-turn-helix domain-containing protein [Paenibacillus sp. cl123]SFW52553.1 Helix-turn-helix domain-containing protein [Paenibacillus sp. UNCCL117]